MNLTEEFAQSAFDNPVTIELVDYDKMFYDDPDARVIPCGILPVSSDKQVRDDIANLFQDGSAGLNFVATCECGTLMGNFYEGMVCPSCKTVCHTNFTSELKFKAWLEIPPMRDDINDPLFIPPLLHPAVYSIFEKWLGTIGGINILQSLLDPETNLPKQLAEDGIGQGFQYFYRNFDSLMDYLLNTCKLFRAKDKVRRAEGIRELIAKYRDRLFFRHIPILNQSLHLLTYSGTLKLTDKTVDYILNAKADLSNLLYQHRNTNMRPLFLNQQLWTIYASVVGYVESIADTKLIGKTGFIRKQMLGARVHCSGRAIITPISGEHSCDELHIPWKMGVELLKLEIVNFLVNRNGYNMPDAIAKHAAAIAQYDPDIDQIMKTLIQECHDLVEVYVPHLQMNIKPKGLLVLFGRNPKTCRHETSHGHMSSDGHHAYTPYCWKSKPSWKTRELRGGMIISSDRLAQRPSRRNPGATVEGILCLDSRPTTIPD